MTELVINTPEVLMLDNQQQALARVYDEFITQVPDDLYIPPDALAVFLEAFEGPLDLLLYLIRKQNLDILDIPIAEITRQYISYIELMQELNIDLAAEYLLMAALLAEIKSRLLLPKPKNPEAEEDDPRAELIRRLQEYERFKKAAEDLGDLPQEGRDIFLTHVEPPVRELLATEPFVGDFSLLLEAMRDVLQRAQLQKSHIIAEEGLSLEQRFREVLARLASGETVIFYELFTVKEGRIGVVVTFMAILELLKQKMIELVQESVFAPIYVREYRELA
ncbi:MAG TPA: segregation/condensation protein A [Agitococcus sp.]|nr:segregation/condensation protein A [Agitococcus sp.]HMX99048.1 segregation/condensation protein A [Agitococcus sp.]HMY82190.1 segregation/condensation protein A [Agitococcus sp.]HNC03234.1 segregation/condensation protein A [Agitococcus sp.]HNC86484.1 segregation/condensation protein A [Agitococcus sp.]